LNHRVRIDVNLTIAVVRPATIDLILTKKARADDDDLQDIQFLIRAESLARGQLEAAFAQARAPEVPEIQGLFNQACPKVLAL
jgi:hypothetical protein